LSEETEAIDNLEETAQEEFEIVEEKRKTIAEITPEDMEIMTAVLEELDEAIEGKISAEQLEKFFKETVDARLRKREEEMLLKKKRRSTQKKKKSTKKKKK
jgi:hypothetical protein